MKVLQHYHDESGFTLFEMLVSLAVLAVLSAFAFSALAVMPRIRAVETHMAEQSEIAAVRAHLEATLADARNLYETGEDQTPHLAFTGKSGIIAVTTLLNDHVERGGLYSLRYGLSGGDLQLSYKLFRTGENATGESSEPLLKNVEAVRFSYFGERDEESPAKWWDSWDQQNTLPLQVKIEIQFGKQDSRQWLPLLVTLRGGV